MIRVTFLLRRKADLSFAEFQQYWREHHGPLVASHSQRLNIHRYVQVHTTQEPKSHSGGGARGDMLMPWDGVAELWFESREALTAGFTDSEGRAAGAALLEDEKSFIDHANSPLWIAYECPQINPTPETLVATPISPYVKFYYPLTFIDGLSLEEGQRYWRMQHGPIVRSFGPAMRALKYIQVHRLDDELNDMLAESRGVKPNNWAGHAELWFDLNNWGSQINEATQSDRALCTDEAKFIDFAQSSIWHGKELVFVDHR